MTAFEIPLISQPQLLRVVLNAVTYQLRIVWNDINQSWVMDVLDTNGNPLVQGVPLITGSDLMGPFQYLNFGGMFIVQTDNDTRAVPTFTNLGQTGHLYFVTTP